MRCKVPIRGALCDIIHADILFLVLTASMLTFSFWFFNICISELLVCDETFKNKSNLILVIEILTYYRETERERERGF